MDDIEPGLRAAVEVARSWGVSPSVFFGAGTQAVTTYEYDDLGRLLRSVTVHESSWRDEDRDLAYALAEWENGLCPGCGGELADTMNRDHEGAYVADRERLGICWRCAGQATAGREFEKHPHAHAFLIPVRLDEGRAARNRLRREAEEAASRGGGDPAGAAGDSGAIETPEGS